MHATHDGDGEPPLGAGARDPIMQRIYARRVREGLFIVASSGFVVALTCYFYAILSR